MNNSDKERGEKRSVLGSGRAKRLNKTKGADESAADNKD